MVSSVNVSHLKPFIDFVHEKGARYLRFQKYGNTQRSNSAKLQLSQESYRSIHDDILEFSERFSGPEFQIYWRKVEGIEEDDPRERAFDGHFDSKEEIQKESFIRNKGCKLGRSEIAFRYDGKACWCEHLPDDDFLVYGDLKQQSIMEVWESPKIKSLVSPERDLFQGTKCFSCSSFDICIAKTSCIFRSKNLFGRYFAPLPEVTGQCSDN